MADPTLYLFDGYNLLHAGDFPGGVRELTDVLASFVALRGARGVLVFDGAGDDAVHGPLAVRHAPDADALLERLAAEQRGSETVCLVSSDFAVRGTSGQEVRTLGSAAFLRDLPPPSQPPSRRGSLRDRLDEPTRERLERLRRGQD